MTDLSSPTLTNLLPALCAAQAAFGPATKDAKNSHFGSAYTTLAAALDAILPALNAAGLCIVQQTHVGEGGVVMLRTMLLHASGEWLASEYPILPIKGDPQSYGSALTYARRYSVMALVSIAAEDDDANRASNAAPAKRQKYEGKFPSGSKPRSSPAVPDMHADALAADLADAIDSASNLTQLDALVGTLQQLPAELRPPLRQRFSDKREALRGLDRDRDDLAALDHQTEETP